MLFALRRFSIGGPPYCSVVDMCARRISFCWTSSGVSFSLSNERWVWRNVCQPMLPNPFSVASVGRASWTGILNCLPRPCLIPMQALPGTAPHSGQVTRHQPARRMWSCWMGQAW